MKLFAPQNNWSMTDSGSWWPNLGSIQTPSGVRVSEETAMAFAPVFAAMRVISETMASFPLCTLEQEDYRTTHKATDHPLWSLLHDAPNPEQDIMSWLDMQVAMQAGWGNAYAEVQRNSLGEIVALWPIHPSRLPVSNIRRNVTDPRQWGGIVAGEPGEIVYYVRNNDGTATAIPASDMLHVPGVLSKNGITGNGIPVMCANAIGVAMATELHAGAFFRNGAVSNVAIKSEKVVSRETAERLREQWQKTFSGVHNHYKTLLLEDGMTPIPFSMSPESSQLVEARQFGVTQVAMCFRLPPHLIGDLSRSTNNNIEQQALEFVQHTMLPWVVRWEKALYRQLLTPKEKAKYRFKFNMMGLLRGDSAARAQFYRVMFDLGAFSPNDIREREDENPIEGGDQHFIQGNNSVPLDKVVELAQAQIDKAKEKPQLPAGDDKESRLKALRELQVQLIASVEERDMRTAEAVSAKMNEFKSHAAEAVAVRESAVRDALRLSIAARMEWMGEYEARAVRQAVGKPETFLTWQAEFYDKFRGKLRDALVPFEAPASKLGVTFAADALAGDYVSHSTASLEPLAELPCASLASGAEAIVAEWAERPARLASSIIPERTETCAA